MCVVLVLSVPFLLWGSGLYIDEVMSCVDESRRIPQKDKYEIISQKYRRYHMKLPLGEQPAFIGVVIKLESIGDSSLVEVELFKEVYSDWVEER